jgi:hypothetical protein
MSKSKKVVTEEAKKFLAKNVIVQDLSVLSEAQQEQAKAITEAGGEVVVYKCHRCKKYLLRDKSIEAEAGDLCAHFDKEGVTEEYLMQHRATMTVTVLPEGMIKVADLHKICEKNGIPVNRMVNAIGKDRALTPPTDERLRPVFFKNARYVSAWAATPEGLAVIRGVQPTKQQKIDAEFAELEAEA